MNYWGGGGERAGHGRLLKARCTADPPCHRQARQFLPLTASSPLTPHAAQHELDATFLPLPQRFER